MAVLEIVEVPDPRLRLVSRPVESVDDGVRKLIDDMVDTMYAAHGIGLAAIQVGVDRRVLVIDLQEEEDAEGKPVKNPRAFVNPEILSSEGASTSTEGCLSFPGLEIDVKRAEKVRVTYLDDYGVRRERDADGLFAICIQHEIDHLDGIVFVDRLGPVSRRLAQREFDKLRAKAAAEAVSER